MTEYVLKHGTDDVDQLIRYAHALATQYGEAAVALACQMYDQTAEASGAAVLPAEPAETATYNETAAAIRGALKESILSEKIGKSTGRLVKQAAEDTTLKNARRDHAEFAWIPSGDGCSFCMMIAGRGWTKARDATAHGAHADHIHPNCKCAFAIRFSENDGVEGYDPEELKAKFDAAEGANWRDKIRSLDRENYASNKDAINARKRAEYKERTLIPNYQKAELPDKKITGYLLKRGAKHSEEFYNVGYTEGDAELLKSDILQALKENRATKQKGEFHGGAERYSVKMMLGVNGNKKTFNTSWQVVDGKPKFITAHRIRG